MDKVASRLVSMCPLFGEREEDNIFIMDKVASRLVSMCPLFGGSTVTGCTAYRLYALSKSILGCQEDRCFLCKVSAIWISSLS